MKKSVLVMLICLVLIGIVFGAIFWMQRTKETPSRVTGRVGDVLSDGIAQLTVHYVNHWTKGDNKYLSIRISLKSIGTRGEIVSYSVLDFKVLDSLGHAYECDDFPPGELSPSKTVHGDIDFKVPAGETDFRLEYQGYYHDARGLEHRTALFSVELR